VQRCQQQFDDISAEIKREMERFELSRVKDFKANIIKYIEVQMAHQQQVTIKHKCLQPMLIIILVFHTDNQLLGGFCTICQRNRLTLLEIASCISKMFN